LRYFLTFSYRGTHYCGWQMQPNGVAVQQVLTDVLRTVTRYPALQVVGAGRTDAGVHATKMVAHFDVEKPIDDAEKFLARLNGILPPDIAVSGLRQVANDAHARFDATARRYEYHIISEKNPFKIDLTWRLPVALDYDAMNQAAKVLLGEHDFTSFSKVHTDVKTMICTINEAHWDKRGDEWVFTIEANRFLRNMVRAIVGTLVEVGKGNYSVDDFRKIIEAKNRCAAGMSVPACGLFLTEVKY
jgi:tRNA pseudouridine38-40 synthase